MESGRRFGDAGMRGTCKEMLAELATLRAKVMEKKF